MPSTVADIFAAAGLEPGGPVRWRTPVSESAQGVYVVALTEDAHALAPVRPTAPIDRASLEHLLAVRPELRMDLARPDADELAERLGGFWLPDDVVLYVGLAGQPLRERVRQYYRTPLGAKRPHAGGWWLKTLSVLDELWVYWAPTLDYATAEKAMLRAFADEVATDTRGALLDDQAVMPFANLRGWDDRIKAHGISAATGHMPGGGRAPAVPASGTAECREVEPNRVASAAAGPAGRHRSDSPRGDTPTQRITAKDIEAGRIRLPARTKELLPSARSDVSVTLRGSRLRARWDPRMGPPERSGVLSFGRRGLDGLVEAEETLDVTSDMDGGVEIR